MCPAYCEGLKYLNSECSFYFRFLFLWEESAHSSIVVCSFGTATIIGFMSEGGRKCVKHEAAFIVVYVNFDQREDCLMLLNIGSDTQQPKKKKCLRAMHS